MNDKPKINLSGLSGTNLLGSMLDIPIPVKLEEEKAAQEATPAPLQSPDSQIMIVENYIDRSQCSSIIRYIEEQYQKAPVVDKSFRSAFFTPMTQEIRAVMEKIFTRIVIDKVEPFFNKRVEWYEQPQLLRYEMGGRYDAHADAEGWSKEKGWFREHDRDISILLYLNDEFTEGKLDFPDFRFKIQPKPGLLVAFPSHHGYRHAAEPTGSGIRYAVPSWCAVEGSERVRPPHRNETNHYMQDLRNKV